MHPITRSPALLLAAAALALAGCDRKPRQAALFELLPASRTGVDFANRLPEDDPDLNILNYLYYYNGAGVAAGDVDGNGYPDLYFTSNRGEDKLYLNQGDYRFEDATERAGVAGSPGWTTGASMADVNGDGHLDIYVSAVTHLGSAGGNVLYVNDGDGTFTDRTREYGLEHVGYSTQAAFLGRLLYARNRNWIAPLEAMLDSNSENLVVVGAAHLIGDESVLDLLEEAVYDIERIQ